MNGSESSVDEKEPKISVKTSDAIENVKSICSIEMEVGMTLQAEGNSSQAESSTEENPSVDGEANIKTFPNRESEEKQGAPSRKTEEDNQLRNIHGSEEHKANKPVNSVCSEDHPEGINQDVSDVPSNSVILNEQGNEVDTSKLSLEEKVKHLHEIFKSFPPVMIKRVLQREDVKEDISMAVSCLKAMSSTEKNSIERMQTKRGRKKRKKSKNQRKEAVSGRIGRKQMNDFGIRNINGDEELPEASGTEESATNTEDSNDPHCKNLFDDPSEVEAINKQSDVSLEAEVKQLQAYFKPLFPPVLIKKVLQRDDVKGDFLAAKRCLKDMVPIEEGPMQPLSLQSEIKQISLLGRSRSFPFLDKDSIGSLDTTWSSTSDEDEGAIAQIHPTASISAGPMSMACRNVKISWKPGNIVKENADILVGLTTGRLLEAFKSAGGPGFGIPEMSVENPPSEILADGSGNLRCQKVMLTTCCKWDGGKAKAEKELRSIVQQCLLKAEQFNANSIAFPITGTGGHGFPKTTACQIMISEVINVTSGWEKSSLNEICFVVFDEDEQLINSFQQEFILAIECLNVFKNVSVCILQGDLVQEQSDAIVNINSLEMDMQKAGTLSKAVTAAAGPSVQAECSSIGKQSPGSAVVTGAGNLKARHIIHVIPGKADKEHIQNCIEECLRVADRNGFESISMPAFGTGSLNMLYDDSAQATFQALNKICPTFQNLKHIRIVIFQGVGFEYMVSIFEHARQQYMAELPRSTNRPMASGEADKPVVMKGTSAEKSFEDKNEAIEIAVDKNVMEFISTTNCLNELKESLSGLGFDMNYTAGDTIVYIAPKTTVNDSANKQRGIKAVTDFAKKFKAVELDVDANHWDAVISEISKLQNEIGGNKLLLREASFSKDKVTIICRKCDSEALKRKFSEKIAETYSLERKAAYVKKTVDIEVPTLELFLEAGFIEKLIAECDDLEVDVDETNGRVTIVGPEQQCSMAKSKVDQELSNVCKVKIVLSPSVFEMLVNEEDQVERIYSELERKEIHAFYDQENEEGANTEITIVGISKKHANDAAELIKSITTEIKIKVDKDMVEVLRTQKWSDLCDEIKRDFKVYVRRNEFFETWIGGFKEDVSSAQKRIQKFLDDNSIKSIKFRCPDIGVRRYISENRKKKLLKMENEYLVKIKVDEAADAFLISGTKKGVADVQDALHFLTGSVAMNEMKVQQPGLHKFFTSGRGDRLVKSVENNHHCVIEKVTERLVPVFSSKKVAEADSTAQPSSRASKSICSGSMTCGNVRISWKQGSIVAEQVDVLVGSTTGQLSQVFQTVGGPLIQQTLKQVQVHSGAVTVTDSGYLPCKHVIFTSCCEWDGGKGVAERELRSIVQQCLQQALQINATSIAFPIIGTGRLGFPNDIACQIIINEVISVIKGWETPCLDDIRFVVYAQDPQLIEAFQKEFASASSQLSAHAHNGAGFVSPTKQEYLLSSRSPDTTTTTAFGNVSVQVLPGDLVQETTDAIVNINSIEMDMKKAGALSKAVAAAAGPSVQAECSSLGKQTPKSAVVTGAGNLKVKSVIHMIPGKADVEHIQSCIEECLRTADSYNFRSISMPAFGTGAYGMSAADSAKSTFQALAKVCPTLKNVREIRIVIFQANLISEFQQKKGQYETGTATEKKSPKLPKPDKMMIFREQDIDVLETISFCFFGKSKDSFNRAKAELAEGLKEACSTQTIENKDISKLSEQQRQKLKTKASQTGVIINFLDGTTQRIKVQGDPEEVIAMVNYVWEEIHIKNEAELAENAEVIYETVKWRFDVDGEWVGFGKKVNADIEKARVGKDDQVTVEVEGKKCVIDFATSTGTELSSGRTFRVTRANCLSDDTTKEWSPMPIDSSGKEYTVHLVTLIDSSAEYQKVLNLFQSTGGTGHVISIERIQNPHLYQQYMIRKHQMDKDNPGMNNERRLFHGTAAESVVKINAGGFDRGYCGKHGTLYGDGVYFAKIASYSYSYTSPDTNHNRHMYLARVLTGIHTLGGSGMKDPPENPKTTGTSFDSTADSSGPDASIFVVFKDWQCYPEYLITFQ